MVQKYRKKIQYKRRQQRSHTSYEVMVRESKKNHQKINKTLVYYGTWWKRYGKNTYPWYLMGRRIRVIDTGNLEIWIYIYRSICDRKNDKLHYKIYVQERRKTSNLYREGVMQFGDRKSIHNKNRCKKQQIRIKKQLLTSVPLTTLK